MIEWQTVVRTTGRSGALAAAVLAASAALAAGASPEPAPAARPDATAPVVKTTAPAPAVSAPGDGHLKGTVAFRERVALPPDAVLEVVLEDVTKTGAPSEVIGRALFEGPGNPPIAF